MFMLLFLYSENQWETWNFKIQKGNLQIYKTLNVIYFNYILKYMYILDI